MARTRGQNGIKKARTVFDASSTPSSSSPKKSSGSPKKSSDSPKKSKAKPKSAKERAKNNFLICLYTEIAAAADDDTLVFNDDVLNLIRRARLGHFLQTLDPQQTMQIATELGTLVPRIGVGATYSCLNIDLMTLKTEENRHLHDFYRLAGKVVTPACLCSPTFRAYLTGTDANTYQNLNWAEVLTLVTSRFHSLELFTRTRQLAWYELMNHHNAYYSRLLNSKQNFLFPFLDGTQKATITATDLGINPAQMLHNLIDPLHPHEWRLANTLGTAERLRLTYTATNDLVNFKPKPAHAVVNSQHNCPQENIDEAIFLKEYPWTRRHEWPKGNDDPRYCGGHNPPCEVCQQTQEWCNDSSQTNPQTVERTCDHEFLELQASSGLPLPPLVELVTTSFDTGVQSLQNISQGAYLGVYVGEMYPRKRKKGPVLHAARYGGDQGESYLYSQNVNIRQRGKRSKKKTDDEYQYAQGVLHNDEFEKFFIDPAVYGNWTRYINHSCNPNTNFVLVNVGQRHLTLIQAVRKIAFGEAITVYYGDDFFDNKNFRCKCGEAKCKLWEPKVTGKGSKSLGTARGAKDPAIPAELRDTAG
jgi:hypothetical protein